MFPDFCFFSNFIQSRSKSLFSFVTFPRSVSCTVNILVHGWTQRWTSGGLGPNNSVFTGLILCADNSGI